MAGEIPEPGLFSDSSQLLDLLGKVFGTTSSSTGTTDNTLDPHTSDILTQFLGTIMPELSSDKYSPEAAARDSKGAVDNIFRLYRQSIPSILGGQNSAGAYNSTTSQLLADDAFAKATSDAGQLQLDTATKYAGIQNNTRSQLTNLLLGLLSATKKTTTTSTNTNNAATNAAKNAAAAAGALKGLLGGGKSKPANNAKSPGATEENTDDKSAQALQAQLDRENGSGPAEDNSGDIMSQILDNIAADNSGNSGGIDVGTLSGIDVPDIGTLDPLPDMDFSDIFSNFNFGDSPDSSGDTSGDSGGDGSVDDSSSGDESDGIDLTGGGSADDSEEG